nr:MAG TPA: hypothetical protein [Bacteriophage sp.]
MGRRLSSRRKCYFQPPKSYFQPPKMLFPAAVNQDKQ